MAVFIALLRGINVGTAKRVPMVELRTLLENLGYTGVTTLLNSGNAIFSAAESVRSAAKVAAKISQALQEKFGFPVPVIVIGSTQLRAIVDANPLDVPPSEHSKYLVAFAQSAATMKSVSQVAALAKPPEQLVVTGNVAYLYCANGILESHVANVLLAKATASITTRNWSTVLKLLAKAESAELPAGKK